MSEDRYQSRGRVTLFLDAWAVYGALIRWADLSRHRLLLETPTKEVRLLRWFQPKVEIRYHPLPRIRPTSIKEMMLDALDMKAGIGDIELAPAEFGFVERMQHLIAERGPEELYEIEVSRIKQLYRQHIGGRA